MAKKEDDFSYGGFDFDKNLDMDFDGEDSQEPSELTTRKVVTDLSKGLIKGTGKSLIDGNRWKSAIREQLPESFKTTWNTYDEVTGSLGELYDHAQKEVSPVLGQIAKNVDNLVPEKYSRIKSMTKALSDKFYQSPTSSQSAESIQSEAAGRMIEETFKNLEDLTGDAKVVEEKKKLGKEAIDAQIDKGRHDQSIKLFSRMDSNLNRLTIYNERVNASFQKKSLELSFRSYMVLGETLQTLKTNQSETTNLLKVIAHHTKLPEVAKITMGERFKETMKKRSSEGLHNKLFGADSAIGGAMKRLGGDIKQGIGKFKEGLETGLMAVEAAGDVDDILKTSGTSKAEAAGDFGGSFIGDWFRKKIINKVMPEFLKNDNFQKFGYDAGKVALDPTAGIDALRNSDNYKKIKESKFGEKHGDKLDTITDYFKSLFRQERGSTSLEDTGKINDVRGILDPDNTTKRSAIIQTDAVPGYLARILKEVTWLRTKEEPELLKFNPLSGKFLDRKGMKTAAQNILEKESSSGYYGTSITELAKKLKEEMGIKDEDMGDLTQSMSDFTFQHEGALSGDAVKKSKAYADGNENQKKLLDAIAERIDSKTKAGSETGYNLLKNMKEVRDSSSSMGGMIQSLIDAGFKDQLLELGLIKTNANGALWLDQEAINKFNFNNLKLQKTKKELEEEAKNKTFFDGIKERSKVKNGAPTGEAALVPEEPSPSPSPIIPIVPPSPPVTPGSPAPVSPTPPSTADAATVSDPPVPPVPATILPTGLSEPPVPTSTADAAIIPDAPEEEVEDTPAPTPKATQRKKKKSTRSFKISRTPPTPEPGIDTDGTTGASDDGTGTSDYNAKKNFQSFSSKKALKSIKNLPVTTWNYKDKAKNKVNGDNRKIGPMAQDVYRELGQEVAPDGKKIDLVSMNGLALSAIQELSKNQEALKSALETGFKKDDKETQWKSVDYLKSIDEQMFELNDTLKNKRLEFIIPGLDFTNIDFAKIDIGGKIGEGVNAAKKFVDPLLKTGNKYFDLFQSLLMTGVRDGFDLGKKGVQKVTEKVGEASEFAKEAWANNKEGFKEKRKWFYDKVIDISGKAIDLGTDLVTNKIPDAVKSAIRGLNHIKDGIKNILNGPVDVYIQGNTSPVLLASRIRAGVYARSSDGKVIKTIDDLLEVKSDIIDLSKNKEVALLWSDIANGLFDAEGKKLKSLGKLATTVALGAVGYGIKKAGEAINFLKDNVPSFDKAKEAFGGIKSMVSNKFSGMSGIGFGDSRIISVLAQIRDLLAVDKPKKILQHVYKRKLEDSKDISGLSFLSILFKNKFIVKDFGFSPKENPLSEASKALGVISPDNQTNSGTSSPEGIFKKIVDTIKNPSTLKTILNGEGTAGSDTFVGPVQPGQGKQSVLQKVKSKLSKIPGAGFLKGLKDAYNGTAETPDEDVGYRNIPQSEKKIPWYKKILNRNKNKVTDFTNQPQTTDPVKKGWKQKLGGLKSKIGGKIGRMGGIKGIVGGAMGFLGKGLSSMLGGETERPTDDEPVGTSLTNVQNRHSTVRGIGDGSKTGKATFNDKEGDGERDNGATEQLRRLESDDKARKDANAAKAAEASKNAQALSLRYVPRENAIDSILNSTKGLISGLASGIGDIFSMGKGLIGKLGGLGKIFKGMGGVGSKLMTGVKGLGTLARGANMAGMASKALTVARVAGIAMGGGMGTLMSVGATVLSAGLAVLSSSITLTALGIAAVAYGGYKTYKYFTRDNMNEYEKLRAMQYGLTGESKDAHRILELEGYFLDGRIAYQDGVANFNTRKMKAEEILEIMGIEKEDGKGAQKVSEWLNNRFKPFFLNHLTALFSVDPKAKLGNISDLAPEKLKKYLEGSKFMDGPYNVSESPFKTQDTLPNTKVEVEKYTDGLISKAAEAAKKEEAKAKTKLPRSFAEIEADSKKKEAEAKAVKPNNQLALEEAKKKLEAEKDLISPKPSMSKTANIKPGVKVLDENLKSDDAGKNVSVPTLTTDKNLSGTFSSGGSAASLNTADGALFPEAEGMAFLQFYKGAKIDGVNPEIKRNLLGMAAEYGKVTGKSIVLTDGSRTFEEQKTLYRNSPEKAAKPGTSLHEFGLAVDIDSKVADSLDKLGLMRKYGFTRPVGGEKWHTEPAGIQSNIAKAKNDPSFAAEAIEASIGRGGGGFGSQEGSKMKGRNPVLAKALFESTTETVVDPKVQKEAANDNKLPEAKVATINNDKTLETKKSGGYLGIPSNKDKSTSTVETASNITGVSSGSIAGPLSTKTSNVSIVGNSLNESEPPPKAFVAKAQNLSVASNELGGHKGKDTYVSNVAANDNKIGKNPTSIQEVKETIGKAARQANQDPSLLQLFAAAESSMGQNMKPHMGSAQGPFQFMPKTWNGVINQFGKKYDLPPTTSPYDVRASALMTSEYLKQNASYIRGARPNPDVVDYYLTHMLGPSGAKSFVNLKDDDIGAKKLPTAALYNKPVFYKDGKALTAGEIRQQLYDKFNNLSKQYGINMAISPSKMGGSGDVNKQSVSDKGITEQSKGKPSFSETSPGIKNSSAASQETTKTSSNIDQVKSQGPAKISIPDTGNKVEARKGPDRSVQGMPDVANGMSTILERSASAGEQLLTTVQQDIVPILRGVHETLMKIYSEGKEMKGQGTPEKSTPVTPQRRNPSTMASSKSTVDRERKYG